jgi:hypothetical protein
VAILVVPTSIAVMLDFLLILLLLLQTACYVKNSCESVLTITSFSPHITGRARP